MAYRVFISHSGADNHIAQWIADNACAIGVDIYLSEGDIQLGSNISDKLKREIERADALVALLTRNSQISTYVQQEIGYAEANKILIVPIVFADFDMNQLAMLQGREYVNFDILNPQSSLRCLMHFLSENKRAKDAEQIAMLTLGGLLFLAWLKSK